MSVRTLLVLALPMLAALVASALSAPSGEAARGCPRAPLRPPVKERPITRPRWLARTVVTEYYPVPESWFVGRLVRAPGIPGLHRIDWLYSGAGLAMEGEGVGRDGRVYHFAGPYGLPWVNANGAKTRPCAAGSWSKGSPRWLGFGWRNGRGHVTFPLAHGGWSNGRPVRFVAGPRRLRFGLGTSRPLVYWRSVAVDPRLIPFGSRIFVRAYCRTPGRGWFVARDTGGAIRGRHIDVYRPAPRTLGAARMLTGRRIFVVPPHWPLKKIRRIPTCS
jgi:hypothetical protein